MTQLQTCSHWEGMIAARHPQDLTPTERASLNAHMATCASCAATALAYERMQQSIQALPPVQPLLVLSVPLGQQKRGLPVFRGLLNVTQRSNHRERPAFASPAFRSPLRTTIATALVLAIIFVSVSVALLSSKGDYIGVSNKNPKPSPVPTSMPPTSIASPAPVHVPINPVCPLDVDAGLHYVCLHKLYQTISQKQVKGDFTVIVHAAYADENHISVAYQLLKKEKDGTTSQGLEGENSLDGGYITLTEQSGTVLKEQGSSGVMNSKSGKMYRVEFFQAPQLVGAGSKQINVRLHFNGIFEYVKLGTSPLATSAPFDFKFPVMIDLAHKVLALHQTITSKGIPMTLETVSITATSIVLHFNFQQPNDTPVLVDLMGAGVRIDDGFSGNYDNTQQTMSISYNGPLLNLKGSWTLKMQQQFDGSEMGNVPPSIDQSRVWNFQFTLL